MMRTIYSIHARTPTSKAAVTHMLKRLTLFPEPSAEPLALLLGLVPIGVALAAAVDEGLAPACLPVVEVGGDLAAAGPGLDGLEARLAEGRGLRLLRPAFGLLRPAFGLLRLLRLLRRRGRRGCCRGRGPSAAAVLAGSQVVEAVPVALAAAVVELVAGVRPAVVVVLRHRAVARAHEDRHRAGVCGKVRVWFWISCFFYFCFNFLRVGSR